MCSKYCAGVFCVLIACLLLTSPLFGATDEENPVTIEKGWGNIDNQLADTCDGQLPGDADGDGGLGVGDLVYILSYICSGGSDPFPLANGDPNGDCVTDTNDVIYMNDYIFGGGPLPVTCTCVEPLKGPCNMADTCDGQFPGDANSDGGLNIYDAIFITDYICLDGAPPDPLPNGDPNGDCVIDSNDVLYLTAHLFSGGPPPVECTCVEPVTGSCFLTDLCQNSWTDPAFRVCPGGDEPFRVYLRDAYNQPVVGDSAIWIEFVDCTIIQPCPESSQEFTVLYPLAPSDDSGMITFYMNGGGCDNSCYAVIKTSSCTIDSVPVKAFDIDGDFGVSIKNDFDFSHCNDYNGDGLINYNDNNLFTPHAGHHCDIDPCDMFGYEFKLDPESNLLPDQQITLKLDLANNSFDPCYIGMIGFFASPFGTGGDEELIETVNFDSTLLPGTEASVAVEYIIPDTGHGCVHARFTTDCCTTSVELTRCFQSTLHCIPDSNVCYELRIRLDRVPILDTLWHEYVLPGWLVAPTHVPTFPLYTPDSIVLNFCTPNMSDLGDSSSVIITACFDDDCMDFQEFENRVVIASRTGDVNNDCWINVGDAVHLINYIFKYGPAPVPVNSGDTNCDCGVNVGDAVKVINYVFKGGLPPCTIDEADCP